MIRRAKTSHSLNKAALARSSPEAGRVVENTGAEAKATNRMVNCRLINLPSGDKAQILAAATLGPARSATTIEPARHS